MKFIKTSLLVEYRFPCNFTYFIFSKFCYSIKDILTRIPTLHHHLHKSLFHHHPHPPVAIVHHPHRQFETISVNEQQRALPINGLHTYQANLRAVHSTIVRSAPPQVKYVTLSTAASSPATTTCPLPHEPLCKQTTLSPCKHCMSSAANAPLLATYPLASRSYCGSSCLVHQEPYSCS